MLDENSAALLAVINNASAGGGFVILEEGELGRALKEGSDVEKELAFLEEKKYIELRYAEDGTYCVRTMPAGRCYAERSQSERREKARGRREALLSSFFGGLAGGALGALFAFLLGVIFGG